MPLQTSRFMEELATGQLPDDAYIFDEALTSSPPLTRYMPPDQNRGTSSRRAADRWAWVFPARWAIKLAHPDKTVIGFTGDGGSMYTIQALWTAARHNIGAKFVICNNASYMLLKLNISCSTGANRASRPANSPTRSI